ncbi:MAG: hypothetical protein PHH37_07630 [Paludibacter sp.]|nr:hypothetical protein [Paludibacter sp.]
MDNSIKTKYIQLKTQPAYAKVLHWGKLVSITGSAQIIIQAVGFLSGILIIRLLPVEEYALYTLANTMLGTMTILSDGGISSGVMAQGGKVWQDKEKLGAVLATGLDLRKKFAIGSLIVSIPILLYLLLDHGASWLTAVMIVLSLIPAFYAALSDSLLEIVPKLHQAIAPLQKNQVMVSIGRLILNAGLLFVFPWTAVALVANGIPRIYGNYKLHKIAEPYVVAERKPDPIVRKEILKIVRKIMPISIYYSLSGQIVFWILSIFGNTNSIAQIGALGRLTQLIAFFSTLITVLVIPRFARTENDNKKIIRFFLYIQLLLLVISLVIMVPVSVFPHQILWILGESYENLNYELILIMLSSCIGLFYSTSGNLISSRAIILQPVILISLNISILVGASFIWDLRTLNGILYYNLFYNLLMYIVTIAFFFIKIDK